MGTEPQRDLEKEVNDLRHELRSFYPILMKLIASQRDLEKEINDLRTDVTSIGKMAQVKF